MAQGHRLSFWARSPVRGVKKKYGKKREGSWVRGKEYFWFSACTLSSTLREEFLSLLRIYEILRLFHSAFLETLSQTSIREDNNIILYMSMHYIVGVVNCLCSPEWVQSRLSSTLILIAIELEESNLTYQGFGAIVTKRIILLRETRLHGLLTPKAFIIVAPYWRWRAMRGNSPKVATIITDEAQVNG